MKDQAVVLERKCCSNEQYSRPKCLEISRISPDTEAGRLQKAVLKVLQKLDVYVDPKNVEDCHRLKTRNSFQKVIIKLRPRQTCQTFCQTFYQNV